MNGTQGTNLFIVKKQVNSRNASRVGSLLGNRQTSCDIEDSELDNLQSKYGKFTEYQGGDNGAILKRDHNFLDSLSGYEKIETLGKGAYAKVYHVRHKRLKTDFALKIYPKSYLSKPHRLTNIRSEVFLLSNLRHPNIVPLLQVYESEDNVGNLHTDLPPHGEKQLA